MTKTEKKSQALGRLGWTTDASLFIDDNLVHKTHDALVWPELEGQRVIKAQFREIKNELKGNASAEVEGKLQILDFIEWLGPKLTAKAKIEGSAQRNTTSNESFRIEGNVVSNSERKLNEILFEYLKSFPDRILTVDVPGGVFYNYKGPLKQEVVERLLDSAPRPLVFVDVQKKAPLFPTMIEFVDGGFASTYKTLDEIFLKNENPKPFYSDDDQDQRRKYWSATKQNFNSRIAMETIETACKTKRIGWINLRMLFNDYGETGHLHIVPDGKEYAGTFAYHFVHRGYKYGCRIVATLKTGIALDVLAIYNK